MRLDEISVAEFHRVKRKKQTKVKNIVINRLQAIKMQV